MASHPWNDLIAGLPNPHLLQTYEWGQVKARVGWEPSYLTWCARSNGELELVYWDSSQPASQPYLPKAGALLLRREIHLGRLKAGVKVLYTPKGPLLDWADTALRQRVLSDLQDLAHRQGAIFVKMDPDVLLGTGFPGQEGARGNSLGEEVVKDLQRRGWRYSEEQIQFRNTMLVNLSQSEEDLLANMKQKTRYNVRLAGRKGVAIRPGSLNDLDQLYHMYAETSVRDGFVIRDRDYYRAVWKIFMETGMAEPLVAEVNGPQGPLAVAGLVLFHFAGRAWYLHGMSSEQHREKMPNYLLQWEAMRRAKAAGCSAYDLWGAPDVLDESSSMWGVYRFKEGLGAKVLRTLGAWDYPARPTLFHLYTQTLPRLLDWMRRRGKARTVEAVSRDA